MARGDRDSRRRRRGLAGAALGAFDDAFGLVMRAWVLVAGFTGIRPGESYMLEWSQIDGDELLVEGTKTSTARRKIVLVPEAVRALRDMPRWAGLPWMFVSKTGRQFSPGILHRNFDKVRIGYGRPELDPYDLRHACATNLMLRGVEPWAIAHQLGHADHGKLVTELYGHPSELEARRRIRNATRGTSRHLQHACSRRGRKVPRCRRFAVHATHRLR